VDVRARTDAEVPVTTRSATTQGDQRPTSVPDAPARNACDQPGSVRCIHDAQMVGEWTGHVIGRRAGVRSTPGVVGAVRSATPGRDVPTRRWCAPEPSLGSKGLAAADGLGEIQWCVYFQLDSSLLDATRAACIALPAAGLPRFLGRHIRPGWALVAPLSILVVAAILEAWATGAAVLAWISLLLVPPGCALALGWAAHGARPPLALLAVPLLAVALAAPDSAAGQLGRIALIGGSVVTVGRLIAGAAPLTLVKAGIVAMATIDAIIIFGHLFDQQNAQFVGAVASPGLPQLQVARLGNASCDYGDFFAAGLTGAVFAAERRPQLKAALAVFLVTQAFDQLFLVVDILPATVPPALVLVGFELLSRRRPERAWGRCRR
jgi:hypothetical protein